MTTKEKVLSLLINRKNSCGCAESEENSESKSGSELVLRQCIKQLPVSGERLAEECGVSRAAIWKAVNALRAEGIAIEGSPNGGYVLCDDDLLTPELFNQILKRDFPEYADCHSEIFKEIDSTNTYAKRILSECGNLRQADGNLTEAGKKLHQSIIVAESQTAGRGRLGRNFVSPAKTGIYLSVIYAPKGGITNPAKVTAFSAVAVCRAIKEVYNIDTKIKWINDIYAGGKKISGILTEGFTNFETGTIESAVIGIGINIRENPQAFSQSLKKVAGSIEGAEGGISGYGNGASRRCTLAVHVAANVLKVLEEEASSVMSEYKKASFLIGTTLNVFPLAGEEKSSYSAKAIDIDENAALIVELADGTKKALSSGEVTLKSSEFSA